MGKGAGTCDARSAMSLQVAAGLPQSKAKQKSELRQLEEQARVYNQLFTSALPVLEALSYCYPAYSAMELEELQSVVTEGTTKQKQAMQQGLDFLIEQGWVKRGDDVSASGHYKTPAGMPSVAYKITLQGEERHEDWLRVEEEIDDRQRVFERREQAARVLEKIWPGDTCALEVIDYLGAVTPHRPNQAHLAEELGRTRAEISRAIKLLQHLNLLSKQGGKQSYYFNRPTFYEFTDTGAAAYDLTQEERNNSPSMTALMAE